MSSAVLIGDFKKAESLEVGELLMRLILPAHDFSLDWRRYSLVSNYVAEYSAYHFDQKDRAENLISSVLYELVEYLASSSRRESKIDIQFFSVKGWLLFEVAASIPPEEVSILKEALTELQQADLGVYYQELLSSDLEMLSNKKKLGMAMIAHDYHAQISALLDEQGGTAVLRTLLSEEEIYR